MASTPRSALFSETWPVPGLAPGRVRAPAGALVSDPAPACWWPPIPPSTWRVGTVTLAAGRATGEGSDQRVVDREQSRFQVSVSPPRSGRSQGRSVAGRFSGNGGHPDIPAEILAGPTGALLCRAFFDLDGTLRRGSPPRSISGTGSGTGRPGSVS